MTNAIVQVNVSQIQAPTPNIRQQRGAFLSQGGTTTPAGTKTLLTQKSDLAAVLATPLAITTVTWAGNVVTATTAAPLGSHYPNGTTFPVTIAGVTPAGYNGSFTATVTGASTFTYPKVGDPGAQTVAGTWVPQSAAEISDMNTTFFAQGSAQAAYVLELGPGAVDDGVAYLDQWIADNDGFFYSYLVPRAWDADSDFDDLIAEFLNTTAATYFFVTTTDATYSTYAGQKAVVALVETPGNPDHEFSAASGFYVTLHYRPSTTNKVTPLAFAFLFGVTPYPTVGNQAKFTRWKAAGVNWIGTGAEGGISNTILLWGTTMDVRPFNYWYAVDWTVINIDLAISNAIINGSNNPQNPLYNNQNGIDRLQQVGVSTLSSGVTFGLLLGRVVQTALDGPAFGAALDEGDYAGLVAINAVPFVPYNTENPSDYKDGVYNGFAVTMTPLRGFEQITFNISVTDFVAALA